MFYQILEKMYHKLFANYFQILFSLSNSLENNSSQINSLENTSLENWNSLSR